MRRARDDSQKDIRRRQLLAAARRVLGVAEVADVSMDAVAAEAGLAKGTLYLYFRTKEQLLLALLEDDLAQWTQDLETAVADAGFVSGDRAAAELLASNLAARPGMAALLARMPLILEENLEEDVAREFKLRMVARSIDFARICERATGRSFAGDADRVCHWALGLIIGLHQTTRPPPVMRRVLETTPALAPLRRDFRVEVALALEALFRGVGS